MGHFVSVVVGIFFSTLVAGTEKNHIKDFFFRRVFSLAYFFFPKKLKDFFGCTGIQFRLEKQM